MSTVSQQIKARDLFKSASDKYLYVNKNCMSTVDCMSTILWLRFACQQQKLYINKFMAKKITVILLNILQKKLERKLFNKFLDSSF